ncbi:MAG: prepilin-type N-terminal cleavage/methylation domain-containing protein [Nitrospiraceae bacterium]|nr:prepilin-type N-terminal cleavage/methylation domain-containing protein [Nitrospiraceae bacterium]
MIKRLITPSPSSPPLKGGEVKRLNRKGDTLVEVLISMVLFLFIFMAVLSTALLAVDSNTRNMLRNEAVRIAAESMSGARNIPFANLPNLIGASPPGAQGTVVISRNFRNFTEPFTVTNAVTALDASDDQVTVSVSWNWKGQPVPYTYTIQSVISNQ